MLSIKEYSTSPSLRRIKPDVLNEYCNMRTLRLNEGLTEICPDKTRGEVQGVCENCSFGQVIFPRSLKRIGLRAFYGCPISSLGLPEGLEAIEDYAFYGTLITELKISGTTKWIGERAFAREPHHATQLRRVTLVPVLRRKENGNVDECYEDIKIDHTAFDSCGIKVIFYSDKLNESAQLNLNVTCEQV